jgi:multiple sugar transport system substrate-binding protein
VIDVELPGDMPASVKALGPAITAMGTAADALPALPPMGLGDKGGQFSQIYTDTFEQIVLGGRDIQETLDSEAEKLAALMEAANAPCWAPDAPSDGPCPVN